jgi:RNA polymerase sigma factor (sigma-70 family)
MSSTTHVEAPGDAELISAVRGGDTDAYGQLFERHVEAARRLARQLVSAGDVEDLVSEAFVKVLQVLQRGGGPDVAFRAYLLTAVRRLRVDRLRATSRLQTTDDIEMFDPGVPFRDTAVEGFESAAAARAFASLPERWQLVLWHTEVEGQKPADVAPLLGMSANSVSALAYRAREGLRQAYLNEHAADLDDESCQWTRAHLGAYVRSGISRRDAGKVEGHLGGCRTCAAIYLELSEVNSNLGAILAPLLLGGAGAAYVSASVGAAAPAGLLGVLGRARDLVVANSQTAAVVGVTTAVAITGGGFLVWQDSRPPTVVSGEFTGTTPGGSAAPPAGVTPPAPGDGSREQAASGRRTAGASSSARTPDDATAPVPAPGTDPATGLPAGTGGPGSTTDPTSGATEGPTRGPGQTSGPTQGPTGQPTAGTTSGPGTTTGPTSGPTGTPGPGGTPTAAPTAGPPPTSGPGPTSGPTSEPTSGPTQEPSPAPTTESPDPLPPRNLAVAATARRISPVVADIEVSVTGIPAGGSATVVLSGTLVNFESSDARCRDGAAMTCTVGGASPFVVRAIAGNLDPRVTVAITGAADDDPSDDSVVVSW